MCSKNDEACKPDSFVIGQFVYDSLEESQGPDLKRLSYEIIRGLIQTKKQEAYTGFIEVKQ